jgi:hypothetical protein
VRVCLISPSSWIIVVTKIYRYVLGTWVRSSSVLEKLAGTTSSEITLRILFQLVPEASTNYGDRGGDHGGEGKANC